MPTNEKPRIMCETPVRCDNCEWTGDINEVPAGECPECGALAYLVKEDGR